MVISGVVRDEHGNPVEGARVCVVEGPGPAADVALITGSDGGFTLGAPVAGTYTIEALAERWDAVRVRIIPAQTARELELRFSGPRRG